ncbi:DUF1295 domain-containing protein [Aeromicrobium sp.]
MSNDLGQSGITLLVGFLTTAVFMAICLRISISQKKLTVVDTAWGLGFVVIAAAAAFTATGGDGDPNAGRLLLVMVGLWGLRLAWHLHSRNARLPEDPRYAELAARSTGSFGQIALRKVFLPQGISMWIVATPVMVGANNEDILWWLAGPGLAVWAIGLFFEAIGDRQLAQFKNDPSNKGKLMDQGLWRYTRHPNYFGDACVWWGIWLVAASSWAGLATIIGPIAMTFFLTRVTGAALNEKGMKKSKPGYDEYVRKTSGFIPRPPKK